MRLRETKTTEFNEIYQKIQEGRGDEREFSQEIFDTEGNELKTTQSLVEAIFKETLTEAAKEECVRLHKSEDQEFATKLAGTIAGRNTLATEIEKLETRSKWEDLLGPTQLIEF